ncbi:MAG: hypothetical protein BGP14_22690 [Sphingobacteriales bacterium 44-15]|nr:MAG: hypothetical protein BGP14_22690 [Sphingobacteriales bacterium 44-15]
MIGCWCAKIVTCTGINVPVSLKTFVNVMFLAHKNTGVVMCGWRNIVFEGYQRLFSSNTQ